MFIKLHSWYANQFKGRQLHGNPIYVNSDCIQSLSSQIGRAVVADPKNENEPLSKSQTYTYVNLGGHEDNGLQVIETADEIMTLIQGLPLSRAPVLQFPYINHRGETAERTVTAEQLEFLPNPGYGYPPGWFITGRDNARDATRSFALDSIPIEEGLSLALKLRIYA